MSLEVLSGILFNLRIETGFIKIILLNKLEFKWFAIITKDAVRPLAVTILDSPITSCIKDVISWAYKKFVYSMAGFSDNPQPSKSKV